MNILKRKEMNESFVLYSYQPEGKGKAGEVMYNFDEHAAKIVKRAEEASDWYANKALLKIIGLANNKEYPAKIMQAWY